MRTPNDFNKCTAHNAVQVREFLEHTFPKGVIAEYGIIRRLADSQLDFSCGVILRF